MGKAVIYVVSGAPGTGKTSIGRRLASDLHVPFINKDLIKESLFDSLGTDDRHWSMRLGVASIELLFKLIESHLQAGQPVLAESNYRREFDLPRFQDFRLRYAFRVVEVHCKTERQVLQTRLRQRGGGRERHPGHNDIEILDEIDEALRDGVFDPLAVGAVIAVDTTGFEQVDYDATLASVKVASGH